MRALIDADSLLYKVGFSIENEVIWNEMEVEAGVEEEKDVAYYVDLTQCYKTFDKFVSNILYATDCEEELLVFTGSNNFRYDLPTDYKLNRTGTRKPACYVELLDYARLNYNTYTANGYEADDYVVWLKSKYPDEYIVCAIDKDVVYQSVGINYNYNKDEWIKVNKEEAFKYAYYQTLMGDTSDGYKGCVGIGSVKAEKILEGLTTKEELWQAVVETYLSKGMTEEDAVVTMRLADMTQFNGTDIVLWEPPVTP
mgnify:CR=1 FL=1